MKSSNEKKQYLPIVDYIKAFCVVLVIITHSSLSATQRQHPLFVFVVLMAVPVFMLLSGYTFSLSSKRHTSSFLSNYSISQILVDHQKESMAWFVHGNVF